MVAAVLGAVDRVGEWEPPERLRVVAFLGRTRIDLTEAILPPGVTRIRASAVLGKVEIRVPRGLDLEVEGTAFLGSVDHRIATPGVASRIRGWLAGEAEGEEGISDAGEAPLLWVRGDAYLGRVRVVVC